MSLPYSTSRAVFEGNGVATRFPFTFKVWRAGQLRVLLYDAHGVTRPAQLEAVELEESGGVVVCLHEGKPLPAGWRLVILRSMPFTQHVDLLSGTRFDPQVIEDQLDQAAAERQQLLEEVQRAVRVEPGSAVQPEALIADVREASRNAVNAAAAAGKSEMNAAASERAGAASEASAAACAAGARAWAEAPTAPDPQHSESKSAKTWALSAAQDVSAAVQRVEEAGNAQAERLLRLGAVFSGCVLSFSGIFGGSDGKRPIPHGASAAEEGWALCDGSNGTPDLRGRFVVGAGGKYAKGSKGGSETHSHGVSGSAGNATLSESQMPSHTHSLTLGQRGWAATWVGSPAWSNGDNTASSQNVSATVTTRGSSQPHSHSLSASAGAANGLPPYYALSYIMKL